MKPPRVSKLQIEITRRKAAELALQIAEDILLEEKERVQITLNSIGDAVLATDLQGNVTYMNQVAEKMTGWLFSDAVNRPLFDVFNVIDNKTHQAVQNPAKLAIQKNKTLFLPPNSVLIRRDGTELSIEDSTAPIHKLNGECSGAVIVFHDVSESRLIASKLAHSAQHDFLTGLPNRLLFTEQISRAIGLARRSRKQVALLFLDLDCFKDINDSFGHPVGDKLLQSLAERLVSCVRATDSVCRLGGDEFVILLTEIERSDDAALAAEKILAASSKPHCIDAHEINITLSIGICVFPNDGSTVETLLKNSDAAMYYAKKNGKNNFKFFKMEMNNRATKRFFIETNLRRALKKQEFILHYQPKLNLNSGQIIGAEALIRWQDPFCGLVYPLEFIATAEECGLIVPIGRWVMREVCSQIKHWLSAGLPVVPVAINISSMELKHKDFLSGIANILKETGIPSKYIEMELTETILMQDAELSIHILKSLKAMGITLTMENFGTGYSSLSYLTRFPIDTLKIDQSFICDLIDNSENVTIVCAVIGMGRNLNQRVIAQGIETIEQLNFLKSQQCSEGQGFHFSCALSAENFSDLLIKNKFDAPFVRYRTDNL